MRKHFLEITIGILITIGAALVLASGYLSYKGISAIVSSIHNENQPDEKLLLIRDIATNLDQAENSIRIYAYTRKKSDLTSHRKFLKNIDDQIYELQVADSGNASFLKNIDTISNLIEQKIVVWNEMLLLYNKDIATQYLDTISEQLESKVESDSLRKNQKFFKKIFKRQKEEELDEEKIIKDIEQFKEEDKQYDLQAKRKEIKLAGTSNEITERLHNLINKIKEDERAARQLKAKEADAMADETYRWIGGLSLSGTLLALLVIIVLSIYIRKTRASQRALEFSKLQTENLAKTKELFMANVSHEIRTPMNAISGFVDQLLKKPLEESIAATLNIIKSSSDHLVRVINEVLDFSKLQSGKMKLEAVHYSISTLLNEINWLFAQKAEEKKIEFKIEKESKLPETLFGDPLRLKQILINLVSNALKFTNEGSVKVLIDAKNITTKNLTLYITIEDTGIGIDKPYLDKIFEDFTQAENETTRKFGGTGLGLSIVKKLVDLQNGTIHVESIKNKGSKFTCKIPYKVGSSDKIEESRVIVPVELPEEIRKKHVLIVDDEVYNRKLTSSILQKWEMSFEEAEDGKKAIEMLSGKHYDLLILDIQMPGADGFEVSKHIRQTLKRTSEETVIILSSAASVSSEDLSHYKSLGIDTYLSKPFTEESLLAAITSIFNKTVVLEEKKHLESVIKGNKHATVANLDELYKFAGNDMNFVEEMLNSFIESFDKALLEIENAISDKNLEAVNNIAHKMASPCRHIGAEKLLKFIKKAELQSETNTDSQEIKTTLSEIKNEYHLVKKHINQHILKLKNES